MDEKADRALRAVYSSIDDVNLTLPPEGRLGKSPETALFGEDGRLDSVGLINFVITAEQKLQETFGVPLSLTGEETISRQNEVFRNVRSLVNHVVSLVEASGG